MSDTSTAEPGVLTIGALVHVRVGGADDTPVLRPAVVVAVWTDTAANLVVSWDGKNDIGLQTALPGFSGEPGALVSWLTSSEQGQDLRQWRWPAP